MVDGDEHDRTMTSSTREAEGFKHLNRKSRSGGSCDPMIDHNNVVVLSHSVQIMARVM